MESDYKDIDYIDILLSDILFSTENPYLLDELNLLAESITKNGLLTPILVRKHPTESGKYEVISGHKRVEASKLAGCETIKAGICEKDNYEAVLTLTDSNFKQRKKILPSEKALSYNYRHLSNKSGDIESIGIEHKDKQRQIYRYISLTNLYRPLLDMVDDRKLGFNSAINLSALAETEQMLIYEVARKNGYTISFLHSKALKEESNKKPLNEETIDKLLRSKIEYRKSFKIPYGDISVYFEGKNLSKSQIISIIKKAIKSYKDNNDT